MAMRPYPTTTVFQPYWFEPTYGDPVCPHCGKRPYEPMNATYTWTTTNTTAPLTFSPERVERFAIEQGKPVHAALRAAEV